MKYDFSVYIATKAIFVYNVSWDNNKSTTELIALINVRNKKRYIDYCNDKEISEAKDFTPKKVKNNPSKILLKYFPNFEGKKVLLNNSNIIEISVENAIDKPIIEEIAKVKFEVGNKYYFGLITDSNSKIVVTVLKRTKKTVQIQIHDKIYTKKTYVYEGIECCKPLGIYSMAPVLGADRRCNSHETGYLKLAK